MEPSSGSEQGLETVEPASGSEIGDATAIANVETDEPEPEAVAVALEVDLSPGPRVGHIGDFYGPSRRLR